MRIGWKSGGLASRIFERLANHCCIFPTLYLQITFLFGNESDYNERQKSAGMWVLAALLCSFFGEEPIFFFDKRCTRRSRHFASGFVQLWGFPVAHHDPISSQCPLESIRLLRCSLETKSCPMGRFTVPSLRLRPPPSVENQTATDRSRKQAPVCMGNTTVEPSHIQVARLRSRGYLGFHDGETESSS